MVQNASSTDILFELVTILEERNSFAEPFAVESLLKEVSSRVDGQELAETLDVLVSEGWLEKDASAYKLTGHPWA